MSEVIQIVLAFIGILSPVILFLIFGFKFLLQKAFDKNINGKLDRIKDILVKIDERVDKLEQEHDK